ncbi:MAG TPA: hypothetical protein PLB90_09415 [Opitutaceae bacterium]|nr:hypothetical protein [Opitutaceae bacterium]
MKAKPGLVVSPLVSPPSETPRPDVTAPVSRPRSQPAHGYGLHDRRADIAHTESGERIHARQVEPRTATDLSGERIHARQVEPRTATDCHVRVPRRPKVEGVERTED